jgi:nucleotide-binding universal stress UspA family protein
MLSLRRPHLGWPGKPKEEDVVAAGSPGPVLFCFDGSDGSRGALRAAAELIGRPADAVVLTVWETIETQMALAGAFAAGAVADADVDAGEEASAQSVAREGALRASEHGYQATAITRQSFDGIARAILDAADELSARMIVCGQRGRGPLRAALLGSVSHALASHTRRPILIAPETHVSDA